MPLPLALPIAVLLGMSLAWLGRVELARSEVPLVLTRPFLVAAAFGALVYAPVIAYFVAIHGDWAYLYLVRFVQVPSAVDLALVFLAAAGLPIGFVLATPWAIAKRGPALLKSGAVIALLLLVGSALLARRLSVSASYAQFHAGFGVTSASRSGLGRGILVGWTALIAAYGWAAHVLRSPRPEET